jgi:hypothetical protein
MFEVWELADWLTTRYENHESDIEVEGSFEDLVGMFKRTRQ